MNRRMILHMVGQIVMLEAVLLMLPLTVSLIYGEKCVISLAVTAILAVTVGLAMTLISRPGYRTIYAKEGFVIVALAWLLMSAIGALPFVISGEIPSFIDAFFETVSGFTTTGASILTDIESMSRGLLFWRSFTHWIGGMGVLVLIMAILPADSGRSIHIMRAEVPGPSVGKLVPKIRSTAKILYMIYIALTGLEIVFLLCGGMPLFDSVVHAFGTAGTGGFGIKSDSIAGYSPYLQWVITVFMLLFGLNFNVYFLIVIGRFRTAIKSSEMWCMLGIFAASATTIAVNIYPLCQNVEKAIRLSAFQVSSILTTTGYATADFDLWPDLSKTILFVLMFIGGCAGSTAGGLKVSRIILLFKLMRRNLHNMLHPRSVGIVRFDGKRIDDKTLDNVSAYFALYVGCFVAAILLISFEPFGFESNVSAVAACINNVGPGFAAVGPTACYAGYSWFSKLILSMAMLIGRLEIYPIILALMPSTWIKK